MSQGGSETVSFESDSSYKKNQEIAEAYESRLFDQAKGESKAQSIQDSSFNDYMLTSNFGNKTNQKVVFNLASQSDQNKDLKNKVKSSGKNSNFISIGNSI